jgi:hypothetical protein
MPTQPDFGPKQQDFRRDNRISAKAATQTLNTLRY